MEFFEALQTYYINTMSRGFVEVAGTKLDDDFFAWKEEGRTLHPEARWIITDIKSGLALPSKEAKGAVLRFATLKDCKEWIKAIPEEFKQKIDAAKADSHYAEACQKLADFKANLSVKESFDFMEAFEALDDIYEDELDQLTLEF